MMKSTTEAANTPDPDISAPHAPIDVGARYIPGFDGIRAFAVLFVIVSHSGFGDLVPGALGVTVFFAISGFLITNLLLGEIALTGTVNLTLFYARRFLRLYPELIAAVAVCILAGLLILPIEASLTEKLAGLFYYMNYYYVFGDPHTEVTRYPWRQLWSLSVEEHFYIIFPALMLFVARTRKARIGWLCFLLVAPALWRLGAYYLVGLPWEYNYVATETRIDSIAWGCLLAVLMRGGDGIPLVPRSLWFIRPWLVAIAVALIVFSVVYRNEDFRWTWRFTVQGVALALLIGNILFDPRWRWAVALLELRPLRYIGRISYGLYLYHMLVVRILIEYRPGMSRLPLTTLTVILTLLIATISYLLLETPLKALRRRLGSHVR